MKKRGKTPKESLVIIARKVAELVYVITTSNSTFSFDHQ
jgi:phage-related protein